MKHATTNATDLILVRFTGDKETEGWRKLHKAQHRSL
jgi:hypothetical protein